MFDFDASGVISRGDSLKDTGRALLDLVIRVANGELTSAERTGDDSLMCVARRHGYHVKSEEEIMNHCREV
jgi:altronate dehydratase